VLPACVPLAMMMFSPLTAPPPGNGPAAERLVGSSYVASDHVFTPLGGGSDLGKRCALGGTRTPNLLIRRYATSVQHRPAIATVVRPAC
jgi:hypothetical protein